MFPKKTESKSATKPHFANRSAVVVFSASGKCFSDEEIGEVSVTFMGLSFSSPSSSSQLGFSSTQLEEEKKSKLQSKTIFTGLWFLGAVNIVNSSVIDSAVKLGSYTNGPNCYNNIVGS